jgi:A/G-specific adenine glycosylase
MLQQTQVETVKPYYRRWLEKFPTVNSVAEAEPDELLKIWEGLGYYQRCWNIHAAAKTIKSEYSGRIPDSRKELIALPGIGDYTADAILSIAFGKARPAIDSNIKRVMSRLHGIKILGAKENRHIRAFLEEKMRQIHPGNVNEALMDLGSAVCLSVQPRCDVCPFKTYCAAYLSGHPEQYPMRKKKRKIPHFNISAGLIIRGELIYIQKRPNTGLLAGLWEFPGGKIKSGEQPEQALKRELWEECGFSVDVGKYYGTVKHIYSHFSITISLYRCRIISEAPDRAYPQYKWIKYGDLDRYAFPKANHKLFELLKQTVWE